MNIYICITNGFDYIRHRPSGHIGVRHLATYCTIQINAVKHACVPLNFSDL